MSYVDILYAGETTVTEGSSCLYQTSPALYNYAAVRFFGPAPTSGVITHTLIAHSANLAIDRSWVGAPTPDFLDPALMNTFTDIARCKQSLPQPDGSPCPTNPPCDQ